MIRNEATYNLIESYLDKQLSPEEHQNILTRMEQDKAFAEEVSLLKEMRKQAYQEDQSKLDLLNQLGDKYFTAPRKKIKPWIRFSAAAAMIGMISIAAFLLLKPVSNNDLMVAELGFTEMSAEDSSLALGEKHYKEGNYEQALQIFNKHLKASPDHIEVMEAVGLCYLNLDNTEGAFSTFTQILNSDAISKYKDNARWYLAVNSFKAKDFGLCKKHLEEILAKPNSRNYQKAQQLLHQL